jgi:hypothetical protein
MVAEDRPTGSGHGVFPAPSEPVDSSSAGLAFPGQTLAPGQFSGMILTISGIWLSQRSQKNGTVEIRPDKS